MSPVAEGLRGAGIEVDCPLLPGHGTQWENLAQTSGQEIIAAVEAAYDRLAARADLVIPVGLSMGGALALHLGAAKQAPGVVAINPGLKLKPLTGLAAQLLYRLKPTVPPIGSDIAMADVVEEAYPVTPVRAVVELDRIFRRTRSELEQLKVQNTPVLLLRSPVDNVLGTSSAEYLRRSLSRDQLREVILRRSRHVATLDYDADLILRRTVRFIEELAEG